MSIGVMILVNSLYSMDKKLVKPRTAFEKKALQLGLKASQAGHEKTAKALMKRVPGPTSVYWLAEREKDPRKKLPLMKKAALSSSSKSSEAKKEAAEKMIESYLKSLKDFKQKLEEGSRECLLNMKDDKHYYAAVFKSFEECCKQIRRVLAESLKADDHLLDDAEATCQAAERFFNEERFKDVQLQQSIIDFFKKGELKIVEIGKKEKEEE